MREIPTVQDEFFEDEDKVNAFVNAISKPRLTKYLQETEGNIQDALKLYLWNSQLSQSLYFCLQTWEIAFRNKMNLFFVFKYAASGRKLMPHCGRLGALAAFHSYFANISLSKANSSRK
jgi:hypothetical protein